MLQLDESRWSELSHAYGIATDIPPLIRHLAKQPGQVAPDDEPWHSLWSSLCHQGEVYSASYAAIPHVVDIAISTRGPIDFGFFLLPAAVEVARVGGRGPDMPEFLVSAYEGAIQSLPECVAAHRTEPWTQDMIIAASAALSVSKGHHDLAEAVMNLDQDWIAKINAGDWD